MAVTVGLLKGFHSHHIVPRHLGGTDDSSNLVLLHPYDHAIAHYVRWKIFKTPGDAWAFNRLKAVLDQGGMSVSGMRHTDETKKLLSYHQRTRTRKPHSEEAKRKISEAKKGKTSNRKGAKHRPESIQKMRESATGRVGWNKGTVGLTKAWNKGLVGAYTRTDEAKRKQSETMKRIWAERKKEATCLL